MGKLKEELESFSFLDEGGIDGKDKNRKDNSRR